MYAFGAMLSFTIAHVVGRSDCGIIEPDRERPYRGPVNIRIRGHDMPRFAVFGGIGTFAAFVVVTVLHPDVAISGVVWLVFGIGVYVALPPPPGARPDDAPTKVVVPRPVVEHEAEYESVLVAFDVGNFNRADGRDRRASWRRDAGAGIHVLVTITVPNSSPIDAELPEQEMTAQGDHRAGPAAGRAPGHRPLDEGARRARPGRVIVEEAKQIRARAIVLPLPPRTGDHAVRQDGRDRARRAARAA